MCPKIFLCPELHVLYHVQPVRENPQAFMIKPIYYLHEETAENLGDGRMMYYIGL